MNQDQMSIKTMEELQTKAKEPEGDYLKSKTMNDARLKKVLAPKFDLGKCICNRPTNCVLCIACGYLGKGRKLTTCNSHPWRMYYTDLSKCPRCLSEDYLVEKDVSPNLQGIMPKNTCRPF